METTMVPSKKLCNYKNKNKNLPNFYNNKNRSFDTFSQAFTYLEYYS